MITSWNITRDQKWLKMKNCSTCLKVKYFDLNESTRFTTNMYIHVSVRLTFSQPARNNVTLSKSFTYFSLEKDNNLTWCMSWICFFKLKVTQFPNRHYKPWYQCTYFPPKFKFLNSYSVWKRLLEWLLLNSKKIENSYRY